MRLSGSKFDFNRRVWATLNFKFHVRHFIDISQFHPKQFDSNAKVNALLTLTFFIKIKYMEQLGLISVLYSQNKLKA